MSLIYLGKATPEGGGGGSSPVIESLSITPTTSQQTITATSGTDGYSPITVAAVTAAIDANIVAGNIKKDVTILDVVGTYEGSTPSGKYKLFDRVKDDSNNEIGTVSGFFKDANDVEYAVVCLDAQYRLAAASWQSGSTSTQYPQDLSLYNTNGAAVDLIENAYTDTATENCTKIINWATSNNCTVDATTHCRSKSFVIGGTTYYGQLPNLCELFYICANRAEISNADTSKSSYSSLDIATMPEKAWSSSQYSASNEWVINKYGAVLDYYRSYANGFVIPVLEIPNAI